jgi:hypothetical protein
MPNGLIGIYQMAIKYVYQHFPVRGTTKIPKFGNTSSGNPGQTAPELGNLGYTGTLSSETGHYTDSRASKLLT